MRDEFDDQPPYRQEPATQGHQYRDHTDFLAEARKKLHEADTRRAERYGQKAVVPAPPSAAAQPQWEVQQAWYVVAGDFVWLEDVAAWREVADLKADGELVGFVWVGFDSEDVFTFVGNSPLFVIRP